MAFHGRWLIRTEPFTGAFYGRCLVIISFIEVIDKRHEVHVLKLEYVLGCTALPWHDIS